VSDTLSKTLVTASKGKTLGARLAPFKKVRPKDLVPVTPAIAEPTTGETMGAAAEPGTRSFGRTFLKGASRAPRVLPLDAVTSVLESVSLTVIAADNGVRNDTSLDALAKLRPAFDRHHGTVTAGNASPLTDGASAVVLMNGERARAEGIEPLGWVRSWAWSALDPAAQLLQGPAYAAPLALDRARLTMRDIGLMEMHEAFAAQVLSNLQALSSKGFAQRELGRSKAVGHPDPELMNVMGGSISLGHPFGATGARLTLTLVREMARRDVEFGLVTVCAAGGMGFAMVLERR
jgi:acetyl-CoA acyltransferase